MNTVNLLLGHEMADAQIDTKAARTEILSRIRSILRVEPQAQSASEDWQSIPREYRKTGGLDFPDRIALIENRLLDYGAGVYRTTRLELPLKIANLLAQRNKRRIVLPVDIDPAWLPQDFPFVLDDALSYDALDACDGVLTGCTLAIATTGTLVLCHETGEGRRVLTLIPDYHLCVVECSAVVETVPEAMHLLGLYQERPMTLISGPSATADIEMTRVQGVHGPRVLDIVLVG